jgi:hypothetical protein
MYLRGTMNGWGATLMTEGTIASAMKSGARYVSFRGHDLTSSKFEKDGKTSWGDHWGAASFSERRLCARFRRIEYRVPHGHSAWSTLHGQNRTRLQWGVSAP